EWIYVDLGAVKKVTEVKIDWQHAAAKDYRIDVSNDAVTWSAPIATRTGGLAVDHRIDDLTGLSASARYVRIYGLARATAYGYSIWELYVYDGSSCGTGGTGGGGSGGGGSTGMAGSGMAGSTGGGVCASNSLTTSATVPVSVSSVTGTGAGSRALDNNTGTRWESAYSDPQWIRVDLGAVKTINRVRIDWQHAAARDYRIDVSNDGTSWSAPVVSMAGMAAIDHRIDDLTGFTVTGRYVRMFGTARATQFGYSIWELDVFGDDSATCANGAANLLTTGWDQATVASNFTPLTGFSFVSGSKNAISFDYTGTTYATSTLPSLLEFTQTVTIPTAGSSWRLTFTITGINDQTNLPPRFIGSLDDTPAQVFSPATTNVGGGTKLVRAGTLTTGTQLSMDFSVTLAAGAVVPLVIDNLPIFNENAANTSGVGEQKFKVTDATLVKLN
ncbi:MAG: coagulation factor 5/8 type domain protein, partial [Myxococcales bacterium]|nr:coagulation factor 5/8 type domain protein [Myxococcales bacterium]